jgi:hypothetical protein
MIKKAIAYFEDAAKEVSKPEHKQYIEIALRALKRGIQAEDGINPRDNINCRLCASYRVKFSDMEFNPCYSCQEGSYWVPRAKS